MATISLQPYYSPLQLRRFSVNSFQLRIVPRFSRQIYERRVRDLTTWSSRGNAKVGKGHGILSVSCFSTNKAELEKFSSEGKDEERPSFDINLAVILAGFAFEAYTTPPENIGRREVDAADCKTVYLSESFVREIYDGQLFLKLKKGFEFPAMDPWGTSDPYVVMQLDGQVVKSKTKWGTKEPTWNEDLTFNIKLPPSNFIQVAAWDANLVTPHKRMGNAGISLETLCDGNGHEVLVKLEGMGGGGKLQLEKKLSVFRGRQQCSKTLSRLRALVVNAYLNFKISDRTLEHWI